MIKQKEGLSFHVAIKDNLPNGGIAIRFVGRRMHSRLQLKKALKRIRRTKPEAYGGRFTTYY
jgi:hypothetical protein